MEERFVLSLKSQVTSTGRNISVETPSHFLYVKMPPNLTSDMTQNPGLATCFIILIVTSTHSPNLSLVQKQHYIILL